MFYYPDEEHVQYLYETYPEVISPIEGVTNQVKMARLTFLQ